LSGDNCPPERSQWVQVSWQGRAFKQRTWQFKGLNIKRPTHLIDRI
jgi:hypothetical protein